MIWVGHIERMGERRIACRVLVGSTEGKRPLARPRLRWKDNIKMELQEVRWEGDIDWIDVTQNRDSAPGI